MTDLAAYVTALGQTWGGLLDACSGLAPEQWGTPTELPGWSVKDNVSHVVGVERLLLGEPQPTHPLPESLPHVRKAFGRFMEVHVDLRRGLPGRAVLAELRDVAGRRLAALRALPPSAVDEEFPGITGKPAKLSHLLGIRVFDCWTHEQDVRRALGRPGGLSSDAAAISLRRLLLALTGLPADVPALAGKVVGVETTGALPYAGTLRYGDRPSFTDGAADHADVRLVADFETFMRLGTGRVTYASGLVAFDGDAALGEELARNLAVTP